MSNINLKLKKTIFTPKFYPYLFDYSHRWEVYMGSAGSSKSYFITQKLIIKALNNNIKLLVCRRYATTIRNTVFSLFKNILKKFKIYEYCKVNESDFRIIFPNGSEIIFLGLDEETKLLSLDNISTVFIEEAYEVSKDIVEQLNLRIRGQSPFQQIILAFNPISKNHWLYNFCEVNKPNNLLYVHSTYKDNPFLKKDYIEQLEELYIRNPQKARIFCDGEWGINTDALVFRNFKVQEFNALELSRKLEHRVGSDFGFIDPSTIADTLYDKENRTIYVFNEFYKTGCQLEEILVAIKDMNLNKTKIYFDSAEPRTIQFFKNKGVNAYPCIKGAGSVSARITFLQNHTIIVHPGCENLIRELENFSYKKNKSTNELTEDTTHEFSHLIDALGYAYSDIYQNNKLGTMSKSVLGL